MRYQAAIFDLDGTLLNTTEDLRDALNVAMASAGRRHDFTSAETAAFFGSGVKVAVVRALCLEAGRPLVSLEAVGTAGDSALADFETAAAPVLALFTEYYPTHSDLRTCPYPGVPSLLAALRAAGMKTAVVSNKLDAAVGPLCARYFPGALDTALGEREPEVRRKPAPDMVEIALRRLGIGQREAVYIGDSEIDLATASNAGLDCVAVSWGFRSRAFLAARGAAAIADSTEELRRMLLPQT